MPASQTTAVSFAGAILEKKLAYDFYFVGVDRILHPISGRFDPARGEPERKQIGEFSVRQTGLRRDASTLAQRQGENRRQNVTVETRIAVDVRRLRQNPSQFAISVRSVTNAPSALRLRGCEAGALDVRKGVHHYVTLREE